MKDMDREARSIRRIGSRFEKINKWIAWHIPEYLATWVFLRVVAEATQHTPLNGKHVDMITVMEALNIWEAKYG